LIRVLVADDFDVMMKAIRKLIGTYEDVQIVAEEQRFGEVLESITSEDQDVILMNDYVPPLDSAVATRKLRELGIGTPVLVMSMHQNAEHVRETLAAGANGYIVKTEFLEQLLPAIRAVHRGEQYLSPVARAALEEAEAQGEPPGTT
jgi:DNA-binding NarL/FixJ family response regulator